jgi:hypothetical protein
MIHLLCLLLRLGLASLIASNSGLPLLNAMGCYAMYKKSDMLLLTFMYKNSSRMWIGKFEWSAVKLKDVRVVCDCSWVVAGMDESNVFYRP